MSGIEERAGARPNAPAHATPALAEADRLMTVCNSCRYCEGLCPVFPAMELRRSFRDGDLDYLANLCHGCGACFTACQFAPPHGFDVNVPKALAEVRRQSYRRYAWPGPLRLLFARNGLTIALAASLSVALFLFGFVAWNDPAVLFAAHQGPGAFYRLMPHAMMVLIFGAAFLYAIAAMVLSVAGFWRGVGAPAGPGSGRVLRAMRDAATLRYLDGGGAGCVHGDQRPPDRRRLFHHFAFYGFLLCFASTTIATLYHYLLGREAPYPWYDLPVVLGTLGGLGLVIGPIGLMGEKAKRDPELEDPERGGMDVAFLAMLFLTSATGLALLLLRATPAMGILLALHLGVVFGLFVTMPYGKFVHGVFRLAALIRFAQERRELG